MIYAVAMVTSGVAALGLFGWRTSVTMSVGMGFLYVFLNAIARPAMMASLGAGALAHPGNGDGVERYLLQHRLDGRRRVLAVGCWACRAFPASVR